MTTIYLIRHAEAEGNIYRRYHGWYNSLITLNGYRQIQALEKRFEGVRIDAVYSSDLFRTMTTAGALYKSRGLELHTDPGLREIGGGVWEDKTWGWLHRENEGALDAFNRADPAWQVEGSETFGGVQMRVTHAIRRIAAAHPGQTVAIFSHGTAIRTALAKFYGYSLDQIARVPHGDNTCVSKLLIDGEQVDVEYFNDNSHLGDLSTLGRQNWWRKGGRADYGKSNLWFRPLDFRKESGFYLEARREAWETIHKTMRGFDGEGFLADAQAHSRYAPGQRAGSGAGGAAGGSAPDGFPPGCGHQSGRHPVFLPVSGGQSPGVGGPTAGPGGLHLSSPGKTVSEAPLRAGELARPQILRAVRISENWSGARRTGDAGCVGKVHRI